MKTIAISYRKYEKQREKKENICDWFYHEQDKILWSEEREQVSKQKMEEKN